LGLLSRPVPTIHRSFLRVTGFLESMGCVVTPRSPTGCNLACVESRPHTSCHQAREWEREPVFLVLLAGPLSAASLLCLLHITGTLCGHLHPGKGWVGWESSRVV
jgi:hypothetical protein